MLTILVMTTAAPPFELKDGDRVVWIGSAVAEREQKYGYWETALLCQWPDRKIMFRNLGWSGDTVEGIARASFDPPAKGYERLINSVKAEKPTVIFVSYGSVEALEGTDGGVVQHTIEKVLDGDPKNPRAKASVTPFEQKFERLLEDLSSTKARIVLFSANPMEPDGVTGPFGGGIPSPETTRPWRMQTHARAVGAVAERGGHRYADLHEQLLKHLKKQKGPIFHNTYTFTDNGLHLSEAGYEATIPDFLTVLGLSWAGENPAKFDAVRKAVVKKNELCFHKYRPQNETYLFGFRKHEQGNNAKEVKEFDKLIEDAEVNISKALKDLKK